MRSILNQIKPFKENTMCSTEHSTTHRIRSTKHKLYYELIIHPNSTKHLITHSTKLKHAS